MPFIRPVIGAGGGGASSLLSGFPGMFQCQTCVIIQIFEESG